MIAGRAAHTDLAPLEVMLCYKRVTMVEQTFRTGKSLFATRPIFQNLVETIRGHVSCSFLALALKKALEDRIANLDKPGSWPEILADLDSLTKTEVEQDNKHFMRRSASRPATSLALPPSALPCRPPFVSWPKPDPSLCNHSKCSAKPLFQRRFLRAINGLKIRTVEDQFDMNLL